METYKWMDGTGIPTDSASYLYLPSQQYALEEDAANDSILIHLNMTIALDKIEKTTISILPSIHASLSADGTNLTIDYTLDSKSDISFIACDIIGNILGHSYYTSKDTGQWQELITLSRKPIGNVLVLNIQCMDEKISMKIYK